MNCRSSMRGYRKAWLVATLIAALATPALAARCGRFDPPTDPVEVYRAKVVKQADGDTFDALIQSDLAGQVIRALRLTDGADCPEKKQPFGPEAAERAAQLMADGVLVEMTGRMSYNRHMVRVWLPDGRSLASVLVAEGLAHVDPRYAKGPWGERMLVLQQVASNLRRGLWGQPAGEVVPPWKFRSKRQR